MNCVECGNKTKVTESRDTKRRRECLVCGHRFNTVEVEAFGEGSHPSSKTQGVAKVSKTRKARVKKPKAIENNLGEFEVKVETTPFFEATEAKTKAGLIEDLREAKTLRELDEDWYGN